MAKPALTPQQQSEVRLRLAAGEGLRALAREYGVGVATISRLAEHAEQVRNVAEQVAAAHTALATLPVAQQHQALTLADKLRNISMSFASAAELGAKTAHRFHALANSQAQLVDDANPLSPQSIEAMRGIAMLTKVGNDSLVPATSLLSANKDAVQKANAPAEVEEAEPVRERLPLDAWKRHHGIA
jgi:hypothetical protein